MTKRCLPKDPEWAKLAVNPCVAGFGMFIDHFMHIMSKYGHLTEEEKIEKMMEIPIERESRRKRKRWK